MKHLLRIRSDGGDRVTAKVAAAVAVAGASWGELELLLDDSFEANRTSGTLNQMLAPLAQQQFPETPKL